MKQNTKQELDDGQKTSVKRRSKKNNAPGLYASCEQTADTYLESGSSEIDSIEILKHVLHICDIQISHFMQLIQNAKQAPNGLIVTGTSEKKEEIQGTQRGVESDFCENQTVTNTMASYELILRYNNEIEKAKREKLRCLELLVKLSPQNQDSATDDGFMDAISKVAQKTWDEKEESSMQFDCAKEFHTLDGEGGGKK